MHELILLGITIPEIILYLIPLIAFSAIGIFLEQEEEGKATLVFSLLIAIVLWQYKTEIFSFVSTNPYNIFGFVLCYVLAGVIWSFVKWYTYVKDAFVKFNKIKDECIKELGDIKTEENLKRFISRLRDVSEYSLIERYYSFDDAVSKISPKAKEKKTIIISWISYWPISLIATLLNNPFKRFFEWVYSLVSSSYDEISKKILDKILKDNK